MDEINVSECMTRNLVKINQERSVYEAAEVMERNPEISSILVVDDNENLVGIVTERDMMRRLVLKKRDPESTKIKDIMTRNVITMDISATDVEVSRKLVENNIKKMPITENGGVVGMVTTTDLTRVMAKKWLSG